MARTKIKLPSLRCQTEASMSKPEKVPDGKYLCADRPTRKVPMSRLLCVHLTFVRSCPEFLAFTRLACVQPIFVRSCPDFSAFIFRLSCVHVQTFVRSPEFRALNQFLVEASMSKPSQKESNYVQTVPHGRCLCPDFRAFTTLSCVHVQNFVRSPDLRQFNRFSCAHVQTLVRSPDFRAFKFRILCVHQTFVRSCPDFCAFIKRGCDDPIFVPSGSDVKNFFKPNTICLGDFRCL